MWIVVCNELSTFSDCFRVTVGRLNVYSVCSWPVGSCSVISTLIDVDMQLTTLYNILPFGFPIFAVLYINTLRLQSFSISIVLLGHWCGSRSCLHSAVLLNYYRRRCSLITDGDTCFHTSASCILVDAVGSHHAGLSSGSGASTSFAIYRDLVWCVLCLQHLQKPQLLMSVRSLLALPTTQDFIRFSYYQQKVLRPMTRFRGNG